MSEGIGCHQGCRGIRGHWGLSGGVGVHWGLTGSVGTQGPAGV